MIKNKVKKKDKVRHREKLVTTHNGLHLTLQHTKTYTHFQPTHTNPTPTQYSLFHNVAFLMPAVHAFSGPHTPSFSPSPPYIYPLPLSLTTNHSHSHTFILKFKTLTLPHIFLLTFSLVLVRRHGFRLHIQGLRSRLRRRSLLRLRRLGSRFSGVFSGSVSGCRRRRICLRLACYDRRFHCYVNGRHFEALDW